MCKRTEEAPNAIDISWVSLTCPSKHRHGTNLFIRLFRETAPFSRLLRTLGIQRTQPRLNPRVLTGEQFHRLLVSRWCYYIRFTHVLLMFRVNQHYSTSKHLVFLHNFHETSFPSRENRTKSMERRFNIYLFEDIFKYLKISSNELKISSNHLKISSNGTIC